MIITLDQFTVGEYRISGLVLSNNINIAQQAIADNVQYYIDKYEPLYLRELMGDKLAKEFESYISSGSKDDAEFDRLKSLFLSSSSPVVMYVYYYYTKRETAITIASMTEDDNIKNIVSSSGRMMVSAWNEMVEINRGLADLFCYPTHKNISTPINDINL